MQFVKRPLFFKIPYSEQKQDPWLRTKKILFLIFLIMHQVKTCSYGPKILKNLKIKSFIQVTIFHTSYPHCVKSSQIRSFFWSVFSRICTEYGKMRTRKIPYFGTFHTVPSVFNDVQLFERFRCICSGDSTCAYQVVRNVSFQKS